VSKCRKREIEREREYEREYINKNKISQVKNTCIGDGGGVIEIVVVAEEAAGELGRAPKGGGPLGLALLSRGRLPGGGVA
jgi:hypothetical protein